MHGDAPPNVDDGHSGHGSHRRLFAGARQGTSTWMLCVI
ncbi:Hypothetical protein A7982_11119 [Minicystis rosea]|nr:Hypothetical protein A7982_11119 [Minicystis rosea]